MQSTGQTSTQALSFTLMHGSAMIYAIRASRSQVLDEPHHFYPNGNGVSSLRAPTRVRARASPRPARRGRVPAEVARLRSRLCPGNHEDSEGDRKNTALN